MPTILLSLSLSLFGGAALAGELSDKFERRLEELNSKITYVIGRSEQGAACAVALEKLIEEFGDLLHLQNYDCEPGFNGIPQIKLV